MRAYERETYHANPTHARARMVLNQAVRRGHVERMPCEICGDAKVDGHHEDYSKPLEVMWLCRKHHTDLHILQRAFA